MRFEKDFRDFVCLLNKHKVEYLIVGAYALGYHGVPRATLNLDVYVRPTPKNAAKIAQALEGFGFVGVDQRDLSEPGKVIMMGRPPMRIDLLTRISGVTWGLLGLTNCQGGTASSRYSSLVRMNSSPTRWPQVAPKIWPTLKL